MRLPIKKLHFHAPSHAPTRLIFHSHTQQILHLLIPSKQLLFRSAYSSIRLFIDPPIFIFGLSLSTTHLYDLQLISNTNRSSSTFPPIYPSLFTHQSSLNHIYCSNFFVEGFGPSYKKKKIGISILISKMDLVINELSGYFERVFKI